jgi:hypothetical protein
MGAALVAGFSVLLGSTAALADDEAPNLLTDSFQLALGGYLVDSSPEVSLNGETTNGDKVDFGEAVGGGDSSRVRLDGHWRFGDSGRHKMRFFAFNVSRSNQWTVDRDINFGDNTYPVDAKVTAKFDFTIVELAYEYAFLKRDNYEVSGSFGLHYAGFDASLDAKTKNNPQLSTELNNKASVDAPLPVFGLRGMWALPHNFWIDAQGQYFALSIDNFDGDIQDYRLLVTWQPKTWLGVGVGYNLFKIGVDVTKKDFTGSLDWQYDGPMIYYSASF